MHPRQKASNTLSRWDWIVVPRLGFQGNPAGYLKKCSQYCSFWELVWVAGLWGLAWDCPCPLPGCKYAHWGRSPKHQGSHTPTKLQLGFRGVQVCCHVAYSFSQAGWGPVDIINGSPEHLSPDQGPVSCGRSMLLVLSWCLMAFVNLSATGLVAFMTSTRPGWPKLSHPKKTL